MASPSYRLPFGSEEDGIGFRSAGTYECRPSPLLRVDHDALEPGKVVRARVWGLAGFGAVAIPQLYNVTDDTVAVSGAPFSTALPAAGFEQVLTIPNNSGVKYYQPRCALSGASEADVLMLGYTEKGLASDPPPPAEPAPTLIYFQNFAAGEPTEAFAPEYYARPRVIAGSAEDGSDAVDPDYPEFVSAESLQIVTGEGPSGENVADFDTFGGGDLVFAALLIEHDPTIVGSGGRISCSDKTIRVRVDYRPTTAHWDIHAAEATYSMLLWEYNDLLQFTDQFYIAIDLDDVDNPDIELSVRTHNADGFEPAWSDFDLAVPGLNRAATENKWVRFEVEFKCGTVVGAGDIPTDILHDGYVRFYYTIAGGAKTLIHEFSAIPFVLNCKRTSTFGWQGGFAEANRLVNTTIGYYGIFGQFTNIAIEEIA